MLLSMTALSGPATLRADTVTKVHTAAQTSEVWKELGLVDLYLTSAVNVAKYLTTLADAAPGTSDKALLAEARTDLQSAVDRTLGHVERLHSLKAELAAAAGGPDPSALDELQRQLENARSAEKKLAVTRLADLAGGIDSVATHLMGADNAFRAVARLTSYTRLSGTSLATVPVRGDEGPPSPGPHDVGPAPKAMSPGMTSPGATPPSMMPRAPNPSRIEPTQEAPAATSPAAAQPVK